jgi:hypothetical protein
MRPIAAILLAVLILGSVKAYTLFERSLPPPIDISTVQQSATGKFSVDVTLTFDAAADDFALEPLAVVIELQGHELFRSLEPVPAGRPIVVEEVPGVVEGRNSFFLKVTPTESDFTSQRAVRVRVLRDGMPIAEETLWSEPGAVVEGIVNVDVEPAHASELHEH